VLLQSGVAGESRFASAVAQRMAGLGAISRGDHRAGGVGQDMSQFDILEGRYSVLGLAKAYATVERGVERGGSIPLEVKGFFEAPPWRGDMTAVGSFIDGCREGFVAAGMAEMKEVYTPTPLQRTDGTAPVALTALDNKPSFSCFVRASELKAQPPPEPTQVFRFCDRSGPGHAPKADVTRFLNRLLAFPLQVQQQLFDLFSW